MGKWVDPFLKDEQGSHAKGQHSTSLFAPTG
jgi:hypothetical protein